MAMKRLIHQGRLCVFFATLVLLCGLSQARAEQTTKQPGRSSAPAPGTVTVDELAAERALERTLTSEGVLLLPSGQFEIEPFAAYARRVITTPTLVVSNTVIAARSLEVRRNEYDLGVRVRRGLPFESQLELDLPYRSVDQEVVRPRGLEQLTSDSESGSSVGDFKIGLAKTLFREEGVLPDLVARVTWDTSTGSQEDSGVPLGIGFNELRASLTAVKRQDPLVFTGGLSYEKAFKSGEVKPGDEFGMSIGTSLAVSPETALSLSLVQALSQETEVSGQAIDGSNQQSTLLLIGASSLLPRQTLLSLTVGFGLTDDAPDYTVNMSLPIRP